MRDVLVPERATWVVALERDGLETVVGFLVLGAGWIEQLYLEPDHIGRHLGDHLMRLAKEQCPGGLQLWTFAVNAAARRFYARHGFVEVEHTDGAGNEEREPDVRLVWHPQT
jgi:GNAT superfamily N-acetyltransferase